jgi:hypothetical protein
VLLAAAIRAAVAIREIRLTRIAQALKTKNLAGTVLPLTLRLATASGRRPGHSGERVDPLGRDAEEVVFSGLQRPTDAAGCGCPSAPIPPRLVLGRRIGRR